MGEMEGHFDFEEFLFLVSLVFLFLEFLVEGETGDDGFDVHTFLVLGGFGGFLDVFLGGEFYVAEETVLGDYDV
jgi:hypothetical protein